MGTKRTLGAAVAALISAALLFAAWNSIGALGQYGYVLWSRTLGFAILGGLAGLYPLWLIGAGRRARAAGRQGDPGDPVDAAAEAPASTGPLRE